MVSRKLVFDITGYRFYCDAHVWSWGHGGHGGHKGHDSHGGQGDIRNEPSM